MRHLNVTARLGNQSDPSLACCSEQAAIQCGKRKPFTACHIQVNRLYAESSKLRAVIKSLPEEQARLVARAQHKTLNAAFRKWLEQYAAHAGGGGGGMR